MVVLQNHSMSNSWRDKSFMLSLFRLKSLSEVQLWLFVLFLIYFLLEAAVRDGRALIEEVECVARLPLLPSTFVDIQDF